MFFFLDIETTGLCHEKDFMLEIACVAYDGRVQGAVSAVIDPAEGEEGTNDPWSQRIGDYVYDMHTKNGLLRDIDGGVGQSLADAEKLVADFISKVGGDRAVIAGNSISFDRRFIRHQMPTLEKCLGHRMFDCSTLIMLSNAERPTLTPPKSETAHRALADCMESIGIYQHYAKALEGLKS